VFGRGAGSEIVVALVLLDAQRADTLHVAKQKRLAPARSPSSMPSTFNSCGSSSAACEPWRTSSSRSSGETLRSLAMRSNSARSSRRISFSSRRCLSQPANVLIRDRGEDMVWHERSWHTSACQWTTDRPRRRCAGSKTGLGAEALGRPGIEAAGNGNLVAAALGRDMETDDSGIRDQRREIRGFEEALGLRMHRIE
jgi:hypothetical protein